MPLQHVHCTFQYIQVISHAFTVDPEDALLTISNLATSIVQDGSTIEPCLG